jgi:hypothetical protein
MCGTTSVLHLYTEKKSPQRLHARISPRTLSFRGDRPTHFDNLTDSHFDYVGLFAIGVSLLGDRRALPVVILLRYRVDCGIRIPEALIATSV